MSRIVQISDHANKDLDEIYDYIYEAANSGVADRIASEIYTRFGEIADNVAVGHRRDDLTPNDVWFSGVYSFLVVYKLSATVVSVIAVLHMARDAEVILGERL